MMTSIPRSIVSFLTILLAAASLHAQNATGSQQLTFAGLRSVANQGQFNAVKTDSSGNLYLLLDQGDGVRILKVDPTASTVLAQSQLGATGDVGLSLTLDPTGNVYVAGTTTSTTLAGTSGAAFPTRADTTTTNSFVAKYDPSLNNLWVTFAGSGHLAATAVAATSDAVFLAGSLFTATLPVTSGGFQQTPASGSSQHGFVERFSADGTTLVYATYLTGTNGNTSPAALAADSSDNAYIAGYTSASGFPTLAALSPILASTGYSGFLTKLTPAGDALKFSTFIPGSGVTSLALDATANNLILSGAIDLARFPVANVQSPLVAQTYQVLERIPLDGSSVLSSTLIAPGNQSSVTPGLGGDVWANGTASPVLLPLTPLATTGAAYAAHITQTGAIDQTARFGGLATTNQTYASAPVTLTSLTTDPTGQPILAGAFTPTADSSLLATQRFDLSLTNSPTAAFPSAVRDTQLPANSCANSGQCTGSAAYLARLSAGTAAPALAFSIGASPDILLRNLGSAQATGLTLSATGFTLATTCATTLSPGAECAIALNGTGPGTLTAQATNATTQTATLPANTLTPTPIVFSPRELDFGIQTLSSASTTRTVTVTNLSQTTQSFTSAIESPNTPKGTTSPFSQSSTDCPTGSLASQLSLAPGASCHITFALTLTSATIDGPLQALWKVDTSTKGTHDVLLTAYANAAALSLSASTIDFGTQYTGGLRTSRYLYLSNNSDTAISHAAVTLSLPFAVTDRCPSTLAPHSVCQLQFAYESSTSPSNDSATLTLDQGLSVLVTGKTLPATGTGGSTVNPNLTVNPTTVSFSNSVPVTGVSSTTQTVTISNSGVASFPLALSLTGDFTYVTNCPATLPGQQSCAVVLTFAPTAPGSRSGILAITAGSGTTPLYVTLSGTATAILPSNNSTLAFPSTYITQPVTQWYKVSQAFQSLTATAAGPFAVILVEDIGFGHGSPATSAFQSTTTGTCTNCYLGIQFTPTATGAQTGTLSLTSGTNSNAYTLALTGSGLPITGLVATPATQDFGTVPVDSTSQPILLSLTNLTSTSATLTTPTVVGDFALSSTPTGGSPCTGTLLPTASCFTPVVFSPTATGSRTGSLTFQTSSGPVIASLTGTAIADPGFALSPNSLTFQNVPGPTATQQTITLTNTSQSTLQIATPTTASPFAVNITCGSVAPSAACTLSVTYTPATALATSSISLPITTPVNGVQTQTTYTIPITAAYTTQYAGLQIAPTQSNLGPSAVDAIGPTRSFTLNNLTAQPVSLTLAASRQFALTTANPCPTLAANASCTFAVTSLPLTTGYATGSVTALTPSGSTGIAFLELFATNSAASALAVSGNLTPGTGVFDFGQVTSGQTYTQTLTLTNTSPTQTLTLRRITSLPPFLSTNTCTAPLLPAATCIVTVTYAPLNQVATGSSSSAAIPNTGTLTLESDDAASPRIVNLTGSAAPATVSSPSNAQPIAAYTLSQTSLTFPNTQAGNVSATQSITLTNTGTTTLHLRTLATTAAFTATSNCPTNIIASTTCTISIAFNPTTNGVTASAVQLSTDSSSSLDFITLLGTSYPASLALTPQSLDFGSLLVGVTSSAQTIQVTNNGQTPVTISAIAASGDYAQTNNCPATLAVNASCAIQTTFTPTAAGTRTGAISITNSASTNPLTVSLTGTGLQSHLTATPTLLSFGNIGVGSSFNLSLTLANTGTASLSSLALAITGDYTVATPCSTATLAPSQSCTVTLTFTPAAIGPRTGTLTVTSTDATSPIAISLTGNGIQSRLALAPTTLAFGTVPLGASSTLSVTLTNSGTASLTNLTPTIAGDYRVASSCPATLAANQTCTLQIAFTPTALGSRTGTLTLTSSDPASPTTVPLSGTGTNTPSHLAVTPTALAFGSVTVSTTANLSLTVSNTGTNAINTIAQAITGDYTITQPCPATLPAAQSCTVNIAFTPTATGTRNGTLTLTSSDPSSPISIALTGTGTAAPVQPRLQVTPATLNFGSIPVNSSAALTVTLSNPTTVQVSSIALAITGDYAVVSTCTATLAPAASCTATVTFTPKSLSTRTGTLTVASSDPASPATIALTGAATTAPSTLQIAPASLTFSSTTVGASAIQTITLTNTSPTASIASLTPTLTGTDYTLTSACPTTLPATQSCTLTVTFTPTAAGTRTGALTLTSSDSASPATILLTGTATAAPTSPGSFTLTVNGASTASATVASGSTATFGLSVNPTGGFTGPVVFNCTPPTNATYTSCAMLPSTVTVFGTAAQSSTVTITTLTSLANPQTASTPAAKLLLALLAPGCLLVFRRRRTRRSLPLLFAWTLLYAFALSATGCGGGPNLTIRYVTPGTYQYQITASSTAVAPITQSVTVSVTITNN